MPVSFAVQFLQDTVETGLAGTAPEIWKCIDKAVFQTERRSGGGLDCWRPGGIEGCGPHAWEEEGQGALLG